MPLKLRLLRRYMTLRDNTGILEYTTQYSPTISDIAVMTTIIIQGIVDI